jgi:hypothetical protein
MGNLLSVGQGSLLILDRHGNVVTTLTDSKLLDGPWDLTVNQRGNQAQVSVSNVLNGVVTRIDLFVPSSGNPSVESMTEIASGYLFRTDPAALVVGPTGLAFDARHDILYVASTGDNEIFAIRDAARRSSDAGKGNLVYQDNAHLHGPLGLVLVPNGDLITSNGDAVNPDPKQNSELVEFTPGGHFVGEFQVDPAVGSAFGIVVSTLGRELRFAAVDDNTNSLDVWTFSVNRGRFLAADIPPVEAGQPSGTNSTVMGTVPVVQTGGSAVTAPSPGSPGQRYSTGVNATSVDQFFLSIPEEELRSAVFGQPDVVQGRRKNPLDPWTV